MRIALFDYVVTPHSGPGGCDVEVIRALDGEHEVTVFASELALSGNGGGSVGHVHVRTVRHPGVASFVLYLGRAVVAYRRLRRRGERFDLVQATDCSFPMADVCYAHLCHRAFLAEVWPQIRSRLTPRTVHTWANHKVRALIEPRLVRSARVIVVPSEGLRRDLVRFYPGVDGKVMVIRNAVDLAHYAQPPEFDRQRFRQRMDAGQAEVVFVFVALGHFERKGLPLLLEALSTNEPRFAHARLWVVGGEAGLIASYRKVVERLHLERRVTFAGRTADVRPFLWAADAFVAPSYYEAFSLALLEAAAAGLPLISTRISGSEEVLEDGVNGFEVERDPPSVRAALNRFLDLDRAGREAMRCAAQQSVAPLGPERFAAAWRSLYASLAG
jgi:glycosyltransferase involved in cell wall biosynthesis